MSALHKMLLGLLAACACVLVALTLHGLREAPRPVTSPDSARPAPAEVTASIETTPWQPAPDTRTALPPGTVPVSQIDPPRPDPALSLPPSRVIEPANPALFRPPMDNPGGVDGDRPPRESGR